MLEFLQPFHPKVVHFPIALFITALGLEVSSWIFNRDSLHKSAWHLYIVAAFLSIVVVRTGIWEEERLHLHHPVLELHETYALWTMWISLGALPMLWILKRMAQKIFRVVFALVLVVISGLITFTAHQGGRLVYEYGVGVSP